MFQYIQTPFFLIIDKRFLRYAAINSAATQDHTTFLPPTYLPTKLCWRTDMLKVGPMLQVTTIAGEIFGTRLKSRAAVVVNWMRSAKDSVLEAFVWTWQYIHKTRMAAGLQISNWHLNDQTDQTAPPGKKTTSKSGTYFSWHLHNTTSHPHLSPFLKDGAFHRPALHGFDCRS